MVRPPEKLAGEEQDMSEKMREAAQQLLVAVLGFAYHGKAERWTDAVNAYYAALAEPEPDQEPVEYQHRSRPPWETVWGGWFKCSKADAERYSASPIINDYFHEVRELYTHPPKAEPEPVQERVAWMDIDGYRVGEEE
jgi:hypothetical protein